MLTDDQIQQLWERKISAEVRSLYFAEMASRYSRRKHVITFVTFFLASGAASSILAKADPWVPLVLSVAVALLSAYSVAFGLEKLVPTLAKLHYSWHQLAVDYDRLWNETYAGDAQSRLNEFVRSEGRLSELATTETPAVDWKRLSKWQDHVFQQYHLNEA